MESCRTRFWFWVVACLFLRFGITQCEAAETSTNNIPIKPEAWFDRSAVITAIFVGAVGLGYGLLQVFLKKRIIRGINDPVEIAAGEKRNSIILFGIGGTGKTTFIRSLLQNPNANPEKKTRKYELFSGKIVAGGTTYNLYISDYVGQNIGTLISAFIWQQKWQFSPMAYGHITSLVLMVDLVGDPKTANGVPDMQRVRSQLDQWNHTALSAVWGLLRKESLKYVCLFINKADLMADATPAAAIRYQELYASLANDLERRIKPKATGIKLGVFYGSASVGFAPVIAQLLANSVDASHNPKIKEEEEANGDSEEEESE